MLLMEFPKETTPMSESLYVQETEMQTVMNLDCSKVIFCIFEGGEESENINDLCGTYQIGDKEANEALIEGIQHCNNKS